MKLNIDKYLYLVHMHICVDRDAALKNAVPPQWVAKLQFGREE